ncbi:transposable element Tcb1 transposase [Trichonephila clavipes]|nr:transposable element Tcb1 transposase [Trichonephila clavipes]
MDQYNFVCVLTNHVHHYICIVFPQDDVIYRQDTAKSHTADSARAWFEEHQDEFTLLPPWPVNSPDLRLIENLRDHLNRIVHVLGPHQRHVMQLATTLESTCLKILVNTFRNLFDYLPSRLATVRSANSGYSGF